MTSFLDIARLEKIERTISWVVTASDRLPVWTLQETLMGQGDCGGPSETGSAKSLGLEDVLQAYLWLKPKKDNEPGIDRGEHDL